MAPDSALAYEPLGGELHRHGSEQPHAHPHAGPHTHEHHHAHPHDHPESSGGPGHSHGPVDRSIMRSRKGLRAVGLSLAVLGLAALAQTIIFIASGSIALLADLIGNHARADAYVSLAVVASAAVVALGLAVVDPLIGLGITVVILKITRDSWRTVRGAHAY